MCGLLKGPVVVRGNPLHQVHLGAGDAADGPVPVVSNPHVQVAGVEVLKVLVEGDKLLRGGKEGGRKEDAVQVSRGVAEVRMKMR